LNIQHIKLYHFPMSRSARVKWLLHELLDEAFDVEVMRLYEGEQYQPENLLRNPNHAVPVLEITQDDGRLVTLFESGAMISLLADVYLEKQLAPAPQPYSEARADYLKMLHFGSSWVDMMLWQVRLHHDLFNESEKDQRTISRYLKKFATEVEPQLLSRLNGSAYICGKQFTAADCVMGHNVMWAKMYGLCTEPCFSDYLDRLSTRPAYAAAFADLDQFTASPAR
jgi:glutathione S-transferase